VVGNIRMSEEVLDGADIDTGFQEVRGEGMFARVAGGPFRQSDRRTAWVTWRERDFS
jgi:hypothetical protein